MSQRRGRRGQRRRAEPGMATGDAQRPSRRQLPQRPDQSPDLLRWAGLLSTTQGPEGRADEAENRSDTNPVCLLGDAERQGDSGRGKKGR